MIRSVSLLDPVTNETIATFELRNPAKTGFAITRIEGLGPPKANINTTEYATKNGSAFNSSRVGERNIVLYFTFLDSVMAVETLRQKSYDYFPVQGLIRLNFVCDHRSGYIDGYVESNEPDIFSNMESTQVSVICPDPLFRGSLTPQHLQFLGYGSQFHFPFSNDSLTEKKLVMGKIVKTRVQNLVYHGDSGEGAIIEIHFKGPAKHITIKNDSTHQSMTINTEKLQFTTQNFGDFTKGDKIQITTISGNKTIALIYTRGGKEYTKNILNCLVDGYQWITLQNGNNLLSVDAVEGADNIDNIFVWATATYMGL